MPAINTFASTILGEEYTQSTILYNENISAITLDYYNRDIAATTLKDIREIHIKFFFQEEEEEINNDEFYDELIYNFDSFLKNVNNYEWCDFTNNFL